MKKLLTVTSFIAFLLLATQNVSAATNASISFNNSAYDNTKSCDEAEIEYTVTATGTLVDDTNVMGDTDYIGIVFSDANGNTIDVDFIYLPFTNAPKSRKDTIRGGMNDLSKITKFPITATVYDIGNINLLPQTEIGINENLQASATYVRNSTYMTATSHDSSSYVPSCQSIPGAATSSVTPTTTPIATPTTPKPTVAPIKATSTPKPTLKPSGTPQPAIEATPESTPEVSSSPMTTPEVVEHEVKTSVFQKVKLFFQRLLGTR